MKSYWSVAVLAGFEVSAASKKNSRSTRKDILDASSALNIQNQSCLSAPPTPVLSFDWDPSSLVQWTAPLGNLQISANCVDQKAGLDDFIQL